MTTLTAYTLANWSGDVMGWTDSGVEYGIIGLKSTYVYDTGQLTIADALAAGADVALVFSVDLINRVADGSRAYATPPTHIPPTLNATVTQLLIVRDPSHSTGQICAQIDITGLAVTTSGSCLVAWPFLGIIWDVDTTTAETPVVAVEKTTNGLTDFVVRAWPDDLIGWSASANNGIEIFGFGADFVYDPAVHVTLADVIADAALLFVVDLPVPAGGRSIDGTLGKYSGAALTVTPELAGTCTQVLMAHIVVNDDEAAGDFAEDVLVGGWAELAAPVDILTTDSLHLTWGGDEVLDVGIPEFFAPILTGGEVPPEPTGIPPFKLQLFLLDGVTRAWVDVSSTTIGSAGLAFSKVSSLDGVFIHQQVGQLTATLRNTIIESVQWDPLNLSGPWVVGGKTLLRRGLPCRVVLAGDVPIWTGHIDQWPPLFTGDFYSEVRIVALDDVARLQAADLPELQVAVGAGENAGARMNRILDRIQWDSGLRNIDSTHTVNTMQATKLGKSAWQELLDTADADAGHVWVDPYGKVNYCIRGREEYAPGSSSGASPRAELLWFSMNGETGTLLWDNLDIATSEDWNLVKLTANGLVEQAAHADTMDPTDEYGIRTYSKTGLVMQTNRQAMDTALYQCGIYRDAGFRFSQVTVIANLRTPDAVWAKLLGHGMFDRVRVDQVTPDARTITEDQLIVGVAWKIKPAEGFFQVRYDLAPAENVRTPALVGTARVGACVAGRPVYV